MASNAARQDGHQAAQAQKNADLSGRTNVDSNAGQSNEAASSDAATLLGCATGMAKALYRMHDINTKANVIALNAAIEGARSQTHSENFTLVANQVKRQAQRTEDLAKELKDEIDRLQTWALKSTAVRFADIASDVIDKIDRNLFERNCDCQAWGGFEESVACAKATRGMQKVGPIHDDELEVSDASAAMLEACEMLRQLFDIYQVYDDVYIINDKGAIVAAAKETKFIGRNVSDRDYFEKCFKSNAVYVTDVFESELTGNLSVAYSSPIHDESGDVIGVLSTRFNWHFVCDIIDKMPLADQARIAVINSKGTVLASTGSIGVMADNLSWLMAGEAAMRGGSGYTIECSRNGRQNSFGYCHTRGFNAYAGKRWSAIVSHPIEQVDPIFMDITIPRDGSSHLRASQICNESLVKVATSVRECVTSINSINNETNMLAINAAIQAGVAGAEGESFSVIASEIGNMARQSEEFVQIVNSLTQELGKCVHTTVAVRLGDAAFDTIDKVDRNLFERNCDIQAFSLFKLVISAAESGQATSETHALLSRIHKIYEVYHDIFLLDLNGNIISTAERRELINTNQHDREWFREAVRGNLVVTDLYFSKSINDYVVTFAMPVLGSRKQVCGVITTRFNCQTIYDICNAAIVGEDCRVYLVNSKGTVIGSSDRRDILHRSFAQLESFRLANSGQNGFVVERDPEEKIQYSSGYAHTPGYNNYRGKGWSVIIRRPSDES
jgi:hypothetical protein